MITGETPFRGDYEQAMSYSIVNEDPKPIRSLRPDVPVEVERLIEKTLSKDPNERYQKATELLGALQSLKKRIESSPVDAGGSDAKEGPSIAVLPFANLSADKENEYFSDGLAEDIIDALTQVPGLRVMARTSAFSFRGKEVDVREIGARLNVEHILEGSVRRAGKPPPGDGAARQGERRVPPVEPALRPGDDGRLRHSGRDLAGHCGEAAACGWRGTVRSSSATPRISPPTTSV